MKKVRVISLFFALFLIFSGLSMTAGATGSKLPVTSGCHSVDAAMTLSEEEKLTDTASCVLNVYRKQV